MITRQKISAVLRTAGFIAAKYHRSGMVRGWGDWSEGYKISSTFGLIIRHKFRRYSSHSPVEEELIKYQEALKSSGIESKIQDGCLVIMEN